ncbi:uncharacterized protein LOC130667059 isoform X2 [Microplitis mediator]|uniref:uncharacterized protein LOC130667059 isoform X2 n=1 Tax=Microplitis mediator TaxID=375433 RepID=UPI002555A612|nr:uncharacterized protein LOC130667059 isoform X2 [Microplitis mediator]
MILNLVIILLSTGILVNSELIITKPVEQYNQDEYMSYGWAVYIQETDRQFELCDGTFIRPRVFITDARCLSDDYNRKIEIVKIIHYNIVSSYSVSNIYYNEDLNVTFDPNKLKIAILITDESVEPEEDKNGYVQLNSNLNDINATSCFIPDYKSVNISFISCNFAYFDTRNGNPSNLYCLTHVNDIQYAFGRSLFCYLKSDPEVKALVGIMSEYNDGQLCGQSGFTIITVENLSGLNDAITKKLKTL